MRLPLFAAAVLMAWFGMQMLVQAQEPGSTTEPASPKAFIDGTGPGWVTLTGDDFEKVNGDDDTWKWDGAHVVGTGKPIGVCRSKKQYTNFEWVAEWKHNESGGNSGFFAWTPPSVLENLPPGKLPTGGIEVQILDHGYVEKWEKATGKKWEDGKSFFTTNGDIFAVGSSKMTPFEPLSPGGHRSFPRKNLSKGHGQWNHYYVRAINGELRLWVNGEEVSGGNNCEPRTGHLCLEQEGAPIEFKNIRVRELP
jgi:hypothetical protein